MTPQKSLSIGCVVVLAVWVIAAVVFYRDVPGVRAKRLVAAAGGADAVVIYRLQGLPEQCTSGEFPVRPYDAMYPTFGKITLSGEDLDRFLADWREIRVNDSSGAMCHFPVYGVRFYRKESLIFETSLCWACENFWVETRFFGSEWMGFDAGAEASRRLLEFCDTRLPYDRGYLEREEKERQALIQGWEEDSAPTPPSPQ